MQIIPIRDLKETAKVSELCHAENKPIFVTKNGYGDMVIMSMKAYEEKLLLAELMYSKAQGENGQLLDGAETLKELKNEFIK